MGLSGDVGLSALLSTLRDKNRGNDEKHQLETTKQKYKAAQDCTTKGTEEKRKRCA
jgi:hypothetical protein